MASRQLFATRLVSPMRQLVRRNYSIQVAPQVQAEIDATRAHADKTAELWRRITLYFFAPLLGVTGYVVYGMAQDHLHHLQEHPPQFKAYDYLHIRNRPFPWGNGEHSLFHNPLVNPEPEE
ncbi:hypothetical protein IWQ62_002671 [Dispira parvispora]|uniref:Cytochrome c oxidase subunit 13, mitochondrial n=1 Tax=Dispira parvispora TaxID=1520584 RepID=A0A9W8E3L8_9FUNG|nr:hypothetical protein IWQ62_002671 [Dispira parvispora]